MPEFDVVVVGGGGSGLAAAARSVERGLSVMVLEKQARLGGTTGIAVGSFTANRTAYQSRAQVTDDLEAHVEDAGKFAIPEIEARNNDELRRFFLDRAVETLDWLVSKGLSFHGPSPEPPNRVPRMHNVIPNAKAYIAALQSKILRGGGEILCGASVERLITDSERVIGVKVVRDGIEASYIARRGVILAAGDYANSSELISRFKGERFSSVEGINPHAQGDGHRLAESAGAKLLNMDITYGPELRFVSPPSSRRGFTQLLPSSGPASRILGRLLPLVPKRVINAFIKRLLVTWQHPEDKLFREGAILINQNGERFCDENRSQERELAVARQPEKSAYILLDERLITLFSQWPNFISTAPEIAYAYVEDYLKLRPDVSTSAPSLTQLAASRGLSGAELEKTVSTINQERRSSGGQPLEGARWVLLGPVRTYFTTTEGGAAINQRFQVLDREERPIPGLYAVGQNGLGGQILWGHGLHIAWAMTSGRMAADQL
ncbi:MAG: FAD-dependent oxidoreductase [Planctomycetaceae bacterium]